jgi:protein required for attachment to host cells
MPKLKIHHGDWVVVCDGKKALVFENTGDEQMLNLKTREVHQHDEPKTHEIGTDAPGRAINSVGTARGAVDQTDFHDQEEQRFLHKIAGRLEAAVIAGDAKSLVLVAPPRALGMIRAAATPHLQKAVRVEIDKDFVRMPVHEIEKHLRAA